ncbi:hypothetical protein EYS14_19185 [Alteromonadaceae bacterium M269]|nr:hypothetical protein EYS14_19185 [Alteromonadaceae bacterium M269]
MKKLNQLFVLAAVFTATMATLTMSGCASTSESGDKQVVQEKAKAKSSNKCKSTSSRLKRNC